VRKLCEISIYNATWFLGEDVELVNLSDTAYYA